MEGGGQGIDTKVDLAKNTIAAIFNGYKVPIVSGSYVAEDIEEDEKVYERLFFTIFTCLRKKTSS